MTAECRDHDVMVTMPGPARGAESAVHGCRASGPVLEGTSSGAARVQVPGNTTSPGWEGAVSMSGADKAGNAGDKIKGKAKEAVGKAVGNERLEAEGKADQVEGDVRQAGEKAKDAAKDIVGD